MYALSKTIIKTETAQAIIRSNFGNGSGIRTIRELTDGMYNAVYHIQLQDSKDLVLKVAPGKHVRVMRYEKDIMRTEVDVIGLVRAKTSLPMPQILAYDTSHLLIDTDYYLMSHLPGTSLHKLRKSLSEEDQFKIDLQIGQSLRQINAITGSRFGYFAQLKVQFSTWRAAFEGMIENVLEDGREVGVEFHLPYEELRQSIQAHYHVLEDVKEPALVDWDMWDGNIFVNPETKAITGIVDFERALWGDPLMEVNFGAFGLKPGLVHGYGMDLFAAPNAQIRRALYNVYLWLIMVIECTFRQFETKEQELWARQKLIDELNILKTFE